MSKGNRGDEKKKEKIHKLYNYPTLGRSMKYNMNDKIEERDDEDI